VLSRRVVYRTSVFVQSNFITTKVCQANCAFDGNFAFLISTLLNTKACLRTLVLLIHHAWQLLRIAPVGSWIALGALWSAADFILPSFLSADGILAQLLFAPEVLTPFVCFEECQRAFP